MLPSNFLGSSGRLVVAVDAGVELVGDARLAERPMSTRYYLQDLVQRFGVWVLSDELNDPTATKILEALSRRFQLNTDRVIDEVIVGDVVVFVTPETDEQDNLATMSVEEIANLGWVCTCCKVVS